MDFDAELEEVSFNSSFSEASDAITNSILYNFEQTTSIELATKSLYLLSNIS